MLVYVVRRLLTAVVLLLVVTAATFAIFFLVPRLAGATPESLASRYVGRTAGGLRAVDGASMSFLYKTGPWPGS